MSSDLTTLTALLGHDRDDVLSVPLLYFLMEGHQVPPKSGFPKKASSDRKLRNEVIVPLCDSLPLCSWPRGIWDPTFLFQPMKKVHETPTVL